MGSPGIIGPHLVVKRSYSRSTMHAKIFVLFSALAYGLAQECENNFPDGSDCSIFDHKMEDPDDCTSFWWCVDGCPVKKKCEADYLYGIEDSICKDNNKVDCGTRPCLDPSHCPSEHPTTQVCDHPVDCNELGNGWFQDDYNCRKYWHCFDGQGDHMLCPPGQLYNAEKIWCDWRASVMQTASTQLPQPHRPPVSTNVQWMASLLKDVVRIRFVSVSVILASFSIAERD